MAIDCIQSGSWLIVCLCPSKVLEAVVRCTCVSLNLFVCICEKPNMLQGVVFSGVLFEICQTPCFEERKKDD